MTSEALRTHVLELLNEIKDPCSVSAGEPMGLAEMGLIRSVDVSSDREVTISMRLTSPFCEMVGFMKHEAIERVSGLPSVDAVRIETDSGLEWSPEAMAPHLQERRAQRLYSLSKSRLDHEPRRG